MRLEDVLGDVQADAQGHVHADAELGSIGVDVNGGRPIVASGRRRVFGAADSRAGRHLHSHRGSFALTQDGLHPEIRWSHDMNSGGPYPGNRVALCREIGWSRTEKAPNQEILQPSHLLCG